MRNLAQYPLTEGEIVEVLDGLATELASDARLGDIRPVILRATAEIVAAVGRARREPVNGADVLAGAGPLARAIDWNTTS